MRFLVEVLRSVRSAVGDEVPVALELSSADFLRGGFTIEESVIVARTIDEEGIDFIEVSGGTYERPAMVAVEKMSTAEREGHFLEYARAIRGVVRAPLMLTGGLRTPAVMASIVAEGAVDLIGVARPIALEPDLPRQKISGRTDASLAARVEGTSPFAAAKDLSWYAAQLHRMGSGKEPEADLSRWTAFASAAIGAFLRSRRRARS
jgi:2,4-dienoyl-CoA reductase-like NADH-dependent reductase (Old Yellow Enzyme family)